jgi:hypothetical protein
LLNRIGTLVFFLALDWDGGEREDWEEAATGRLTGVGGDRRRGVLAAEKLLLRHF